MGTCISQHQKLIKPSTAPSQCPSSLQKTLISQIHSLQHLSNSCTFEIQNSIKNSDLPLTALLKKKQFCLKNTQKKIQSLLLKLDKIQTEKSLKIQIEVQKEIRLLNQDLKLNPIYSTNLQDLIKNPIEQNKLAKSFESCKQSLEQLDNEAENEIKNHDLQVKTGGVIRYRYVKDNI